MRGIIIIIILSFQYGLIIRRVAWEHADQIHRFISLNNAIKWGAYTNQVGPLNVYQRIIEEYGDNLSQEPGDGRLALDYPPLRLYVMSWWQKWTAERQEAIDRKQIIGDRKPTKTDLARLRNLERMRARSPHWENTYEFNQPMLELNTACEAAGAVAMFLLVHYWLRICSGAPRQQWKQPVRCAWPALFAALLVWFSPAVIFNAHSYPQWDVWILAPFLLAVYFGMLDMWLISGLLIGVVSMGKGQILIVTPALVIWQLLMLPVSRIAQLVVSAVRGSLNDGPVLVPLLEALRLTFKPLGAVLRLGIGIITAIGVIASPWLTGDPIAHTWVISVVGGLFCLGSLFFLRGRSWTYRGIDLGAVLLILAIVLWPWIIGGPLGRYWMLPVAGGLLCLGALLFLRHRSWMYIGIEPVVVLLGIGIMFWPWLGKVSPGNFSPLFLAFIAIAAAARFLPLRWAATLMATAVGAALFACVPLFNASMAWYTIGIKFPTEHWQLLYWNQAMNLGAILQDNYGWNFNDMLNLADYLPYMQTPLLQGIGQAIVPAPYDADWPIIPMRFLMSAAFLLTMFLSAVGMAIQTRRKDPNFFFAMVAPWFLMFALLPQMQCRYSLWAAAFAAAAASFSLDGFLLYLLLNALSYVNTLLDMLWWARGTRTSMTWLPLILPTFPDVGWAVLLIAGIYVYLSFRRDGRNRIRVTSAAALPAQGGFEGLPPTGRDGTIDGR